MSEQKITVMALADLKDHPVLDGFPMLTGDQFDGLVASIKAHGILKPITCVMPVKQPYIIDGRNRVRAALKAGLKVAPVLMAANETNPLDFAIESAVTGRNLTKSGVVLMLFLKHPALAETTNKGGRPGNLPLNGRFQKGEANRSLNERFQDSYAKISEQYHVPRDYFRLLAHARQLCRPWPKDADYEWKMIQRWILQDELSITRLLPALEGYQKAVKVGSKDEGMPASGKAPVNLERGFERTFVYLRNQFRAWDTLRQEQRNVLAKMWWEVIDALPEDLRIPEEGEK